MKIEGPRVLGARRLFVALAVVAASSVTGLAGPASAADEVLVTERSGEEVVELRVGEFSSESSLTYPVRGPGLSWYALPAGPNDEEAAAAGDIFSFVPGEQPTPVDIGLQHPAYNFVTPLDSPEGLRFRGIVLSEGQDRISGFVDTMSGTTYEAPVFRVIPSLDASAVVQLETNEAGLVESVSTTNLSSGLTTPMSADLSTAGAVGSTISSDGSAVAVASADNSGFVLVVIEPETGVETRFAAPDDTYPFPVGFAGPDNRYVYHQSAGVLHRLDRSTGTDQVVATLDRSRFSAVVSSNGEWLAYVSAAEPSTVKTVAVDGSSERHFDVSVPAALAGDLSIRPVGVADDGRSLHLSASTGSGPSDTVWYVSLSLDKVVAVADASTLAEILGAWDYTAKDASTLRLYRAFLDREPDVDGAKYWIAQTRNGASEDDLAYGFGQSTEFLGRYGQLNNADFLGLIYQNVLGRAPDPDGFRYWIGLMDDGTLDQNSVVRWVVANDEFIARHPYLPPTT